MASPNAELKKEDVRAGEMAGGLYDPDALGD